MYHMPNSIILPMYDWHKELVDVAITLIVIWAYSGGTIVGSCYKYIIGSSDPCGMPLIFQQSAGTPFTNMDQLQSQHW